MLDHVALRLRGSAVVLGVSDQVHHRDDDEGSAAGDYPRKDAHADAAGIEAGKNADYHGKQDHCREKTLQCLDDAFKLGYAEFDDVRKSPAFAPLRGDPRFEAILKQHEKK